jgi:hypothetical protein
MILAGEVMRQRHHPTNHLSSLSHVPHLNLPVLCRRVGKVNPVSSLLVQMLIILTDYRLGECVYLHCTRPAKIRQHIRELLLRQLGYGTWNQPCL